MSRAPKTPETAKPPTRSMRPEPSASTRSARLQMADIARLAGVSASTVSRALAGSPLVNAETRERVAELARSLNYSINVGAQNLRLRQNKTVAVIVPYDPESRQHLSDPFFLSLIGAVADALVESGYDMLLTRVDANRLDLAANVYSAGRACGVVLVGQWRHHDQLNELAVRGIPFVVWGAHLPGQLYTTVGSDNVLGGRLATEHLLAGGARHVMFLGDPSLPEVAQRLEGWKQAHEALGQATDPKLVRPAPFLREEIDKVVTAACRQKIPFDAIFAAGDMMAMTAMATLRRLGRQVPDDVHVVGYDDIELAAHSHPPLTTVRQPMADAGRALVKALLAVVSGERVESVQLRTELVVRESTRP